MDINTNTNRDGFGRLGSPTLLPARLVLNIAVCWFGLFLFCGLPKPATGFYHMKGWDRMRLLIILLAVLV